MLSGTLEGQVVVDTAEDGLVQLVLDDADITSTTNAAVNVQDAEKVAVVLADGSTNSLTDAEEPSELDADGEPDGALFSTADLVIGGDGALTVTSHANDGIVSKDGLVVAGGDLTVDAGDDGLRGKDYLVVKGGTLDVTAAQDGLKSTEDGDETLGFVDVRGGDVTVTSGDDGVQAVTDVVVSGGALTVTAAGGAGADVSEDASAKGLKGDVGVVVGDDATVTVDAADDALHSDGAVSVSGGTVELSSGDDGVHADGDVTVSGGELTVSDIRGGHRGRDPHDLRR
nr:carbohydrate-binding domain-containing protein [Cellulosimicrobium sp. MM]